MAAIRPLAERFWSKVERTATCWLWRGAALPSGYGKIGNGGHDRGWQLAHRAAWELANGPVPPGLFVCHRCDNPPCVRLDHLFLGTPADNAADMVRKGRRVAPRPLRGAEHPFHKYPERWLRGEAHPLAKLSYAKAERIRAAFAAGASRAALAREFRVTWTTIADVVRGKRWKRVRGTVEDIPPQLPPAPAPEVSAVSGAALPSHLNVAGIDGFRGDL